MKKLLLGTIGLSIAGMSFAQMGQIENGGFENWTSQTLADTLDDWDDSNSDQQGPPTVFRSTDAADGNYSAEISVATAGPNMQDTIFGYIFHGTVGNNGPDGGISYTDNFDEVQYQYKADIAQGDTLFLLMIRFTGGVPSGIESYPAAYGTAANWTQGSINVSTGTQDELFIGFVMGDPFGNTAPSPNSTAWVDDVRMYNGGTATTDVPDPSIENWSSVTTETPDNWYSLNPLLSQSGLPENVAKTTDAASGSFAAELTVIQEPQSQDTIGSIVSLGPIDVQSQNPFLPAPYEAMPTELTGAYKYSPSNLDAGAGLLLEFYQNGSVLFSDYQPFTANASYTTFTLPINLASAPDSVLMYAFAGNNPGSVLFLDDMAFNGGDVSLEKESLSAVSVYPNPMDEVIHLRADANTEYTLIDITGKVIQKSVTKNAITKFDLAELKQGVYFFQLYRGGTHETLKFIKK